MIFSFTDQLVTDPDEAPPPSGGALLHGAYLPNPVTSNITSYNNYMGNEVGGLAIFMNRDAWSDISNFSASALNTWVDGNPTNRRALIAIPMNLSPASNPPVSLRQVAEGNASAIAAFTSLAGNLMTRHSRAWLRIGWEMDGTWYPWRLRTSTGTHVENRTWWSRAYRKIHDTMCSAQPSNQWKFSICPTHQLGGSSASAASALSMLEDTWPGGVSPITGRQYVDQIGIDVYDRSNPGYPIPSGSSAATIASRRAQAWNYVLGRLNLIRDFAISKGIGRIVIDEWGVIFGLPTGFDSASGGDNASFITNMHSWFTNSANMVVMHAYLQNNHTSEHFKVVPSGVGGSPGNTNLPLASAEFLARFGD